MRPCSSDKEIKIFNLVEIGVVCIVRIQNGETQSIGEYNGIIFRDR